MVEILKLTYGDSSCFRGDRHFTPHASRPVELRGESQVSHYFAHLANITPLTSFSLFRIRSPLRYFLFAA